MYETFCFVEEAVKDLSGLIAQCVIKVFLLLLNTLPICPTFMIIHGRKLKGQTTANITINKGSEKRLNYKEGKKQENDCLLGRKLISVF